MVNSKEKNTKQNPCSTDTGVKTFVNTFLSEDIKSIDGAQDTLHKPAAA